METARYLQAVHGAHTEAGLVFSVWDVASRKTQFCSNVEAVAIYAEGGTDLYTGMGAFKEPLSEGRRGKAAEVVSISGVWLDIDVGERDSGKIHPPTREDGRTLALEMGLRPALLVWSGRGYHAYWLFKEPLTDMVHAARLVRAWVKTGQAHARRHGWELDGVGDLARVLRIAGTTNSRAGPVEIEWLDESARCNPDDLEPLLALEEPATPPHVEPARVGPIVLAPSRGAPHALRLARKDPAFRLTWERERKDMKDASASAYDMAISNDGVWHGWSDQQIADAIIAFRESHDLEPGKAQRRDYVERTIRKARAGVASRRALQEMEEEDTPEGADARARELLRDALGVPLKRVVQRGSEYGRETIYLELDGDEEVCLGAGKKLLIYHEVRSAIAIQTGILIGVPVKRWPRVCEWLLAIRSVREIPDETSAQRLLAVLDQYLEDIHVHDRTPKNVQSRRPFVADGQLYISMADVARWLRNRRERFDRLHAVLDQFGWCTKQVACAGHLEGRRSTRSYWHAPLDSTTVPDDFPRKVPVKRREK